MKQELSQVMSKDETIEKEIADHINSTIMELSCQLAEKEMVNTCGKLPEDFMKKSGGYKKCYQEMFDPLYDKYYSLLAELTGFEHRPD